MAGSFCLAPHPRPSSSRGESRLFLRNGDVLPRRLGNLPGWPVLSSEFLARDWPRVICKEDIASRVVSSVSRRVLETTSHSCADVLHSQIHFESATRSARSHSYSHLSKL